MKWPSATEIQFSIKAFASGMLALYLAMRLGLPRPFWALLTAYVASQPFSGATRSKAAYRALGTFMGAILTLFALPHLINYSVLLTLALAGWLGLCLYISLLDRTPRSYIFILAGYTPALIGFPALIDISSFSAVAVFDIGVARVEEILLGVSCAALIHSVVFPRNVAPVMLQRVDNALDDAAAWIRHVLNNEDQEQIEIDHIRLSQDITELRMMATHLPFDASNLRWASRNVGTIQNRLSSIVLYMSSVENTLKTLRESDREDARKRWQHTFNRVTSWIDQKQAHTNDESAPPYRAIDESTPTIDSHATWQQMLELNLASHLKRLIDACESCFYQRQQIALAMAGKKMDQAYPTLRKTPKVPHVDHGLALMSAIAAFLAVCASTGFWILSGWPLGFAAPMMCSLFCVFFASLDNPIPVLKTSLVFTVLSSPIAGIYLLYLMPSAHSFESMALVLAPFLLIGGVYLARPSTLIYAVPLCFTPLANFMMIDMGRAGMTSFLNSQISQAIGIGFAVLFTGLLRSASAKWLVMRMLNTIRNEIIQLAQSARPPAPTAVAAQMIDRVSLLMPRVAGMDARKKQLVANALQDMRIKLNLVHLRRVQHRLRRRNITIQPLLDALSNHFQRKTARLAGRSDLRKETDQTLLALCSTAAFPMRNEAIAALAGVRRDLFPNHKSGTQ